MQLSQYCPPADIKNLLSLRVSIIASESNRLRGFGEGWGEGVKVRSVDARICNSRTDERKGWPKRGVRNFAVQTVEPDDLHCKTTSSPRLPSFGRSLILEDQPDVRFPIFQPCPTVTGSRASSGPFPVPARHSISSILLVRSLELLDAFADSMLSRASSRRDIFTFFERDDFRGFNTLDLFLTFIIEPRGQRLYKFVVP